MPPGPAVRIFEAFSAVTAWLSCFFIRAFRASLRALRLTVSAWMVSNTRAEAVSAE